jgi:hypothetical protein
VRSVVKSDRDYQASEQVDRMRLALKKSPATNKTLKTVRRGDDIVKISNQTIAPQVLHDIHPTNDQPSTPKKSSRMRMTTEPPRNHLIRNSAVTDTAPKRRISPLLHTASFDFAKLFGLATTWYS